MYNKKELLKTYERDIFISDFCKEYANKGIRVEKGIVLESFYSDGWTVRWGYVETSEGKFYVLTDEVNDNLRVVICDSTKTWFSVPAEGHIRNMYNLLVLKRSYTKKAWENFRNTFYILDSSPSKILGEIDSFMEEGV